MIAKHRLPNYRWIIALTAMTLGFSAERLFAAAPPAGAVIGNQATGTFTDAFGQTREVTSNLTETLVAQVGGVAIAASQSVQTAPGGTAYLPHSVANTGNGDDTFTLTINEPGGDYAFSSVVIYADADGDGRPDGMTPITETPVLSSGTSFGIVIAAVTPSSASASDSNSFNITAASVFDATKTTFNTDVVTLTENAVLNVTKAFETQTSAPGGSAITVTLTYTNSGGAPASNLTLTDALGSGFSYVAGSARWSGTTDPLTDDNSAEPVAGVTFTASGNTLEAVINTVAAGQSGTIRFDVEVDSGTSAGELYNVVDVAYDDGSGTPITSQTNRATLTVENVNGVDFSDNGSNSDSDGAADDRVTVASTSEGSAVYFDLTLTNNANSEDSFNLDVLSEDFPDGTTFVWLYDDNQTPLTDSNGDGIVDTGPLAPAGNIKVVLKAVLPSDTTDIGPFDGLVETTSVNSAVSDTAEIRLSSIISATTDITNNAATGEAGASGEGVQSTGEASPVETAAAQPGSEIRFDLFVTNTADQSDNYDLAASTDGTFATTELPEGWQLHFENADGVKISNTGQLTAGASTSLEAVITIPRDNAPVLAPQSIYLRTLSPVTGAVDVLHNGITVAAIEDLSFQSSRTGQIYSGGVTEYLHTLSNLGNTTQSNASLTLNGDTNGWSSVLYHDANGNGVVDSGEPIVTDISDFGGLAVNATEQLIVRVYAPAGATLGATHTVTLRVNAASDGETENNSVTDTTTVVSGDVTLTKQQALDADCDGTLETTPSTTAITDSRAIPGACVTYSISLRNLGSVAIDNAVIRDRTPTFTAYTTCSGACAATGGSVTTPADNATGEVSSNFGSLTPGAEVELIFTVKIQP